MAKPMQPQTGAAENFETILVPLDFSPCSLAAFAIALSLARTYQSELLLLYVLDVRTWRLWNGSACGFHRTSAKGFVIASGYRFGESWSPKNR